jgi:hypothetical protein
MKFVHWIVAVFLLGAFSCKDVNQPKEASPVTVSDPTPSDVLSQRQPVEETRMKRGPIAKLEAQVRRPVPGAAAKGLAKWLKKVKKVCDAVPPGEISTDPTPGWEKWKDLIVVDVKDYRIYSPQFKKWSLKKVDKSLKSGKVKRTGWFGYGVTVEVENKSEEVLVSDQVRVKTTIKSATGERVCRQWAHQWRSWFPFAKKGQGAWIKEKQPSEWPLRPKERNRYTIVDGYCAPPMFMETEPVSVETEIYVSFTPLGGERVIAGPFKTFTRPGGLLRGVPLAGSAKIQQRITRKGVTPVQALYSVGDHVLVAEGKKSFWIPLDQLAGTGPDNPPATEPLPASTADYNKEVGKLTLKIDNWRVWSWRKFGKLRADMLGQGKKVKSKPLKQGHRLLLADVNISIDSSAVQSTLEDAVKIAQERVTSQTTALSEKQTALDNANATLTAAKATPTEGDAKAAVNQAKADLKTAKGGLKQAKKALKSAEKAMGGGVKSFLKSQAKAVSCKSFVLDVGRRKIKERSGSLGKKCKQLLGGATVKGVITFDLERWDMPFLLTWKGTGGALQTHRVASHAIGKILKD